MMVRASADESQRKWSPDVRLSDKGAVAEYPRIATAGKRVSVVWYELKGKKPGIKLREI